MPDMSPQSQQPALYHSGKVLSLSTEQFVRLRDALANYSGVYLDNGRQRVLETGLARRLQATGDDLVQYEQRLLGAGGRAELRLLAELVLNHETFFFRNQPHLRALCDMLLPELHRRKPAGEPLRIWSAGCATGEEPYSLAIVALEAFGSPLPRPVEIWATDISEIVVHRARLGVYRGRALGNLDPKLLDRYFQQIGDDYSVREPVRELVDFEILNLLEPFPRQAHGVDIIFCQNVTIYFQLDTCRRLIERFYGCLPEGGMLFLGFSETLWNVFDRFHSREVAGAYVYYKKSQMDSSVAAKVQPIEPNPGGAKSKGSGKLHQVDLSRRVSRYDKRSFIDQKTHDYRRTRVDMSALRKGRELLDSGQAAEAIDALRQIGPHSEGARQALTLAARAHADRGDLDLAMAEIHRALEIDAMNDQAYFLLGMIYIRHGQWGAAAQQLERARYLKPGLALVSFYLAEAYRHLGQVVPAAREYRNALSQLEERPPGELIDGVAIGWLCETCRRQLEHLRHLW
jgi:chemotaxis protein methyltransferase CheR